MKMGWAQENQRLTPSGGEPTRSYREQGIIFHLNLQGTPLPVYGCYDTNGLAWRISPDMQFEDRQANLLKWECEDGRAFLRMTQAEAVDLIGPDANYVYNPYTNSRADMGIETPDGWSRLFPDRPDYRQTKHLEPQLTVQPQLAPFPFPQAAVPSTQPEVAPATGVSVQPPPAPFHHVIPTKQSFWGRVKAFFSRLFGG